MILSVKNRVKLEQVDRDLDAIVDAIKKYAHDHGGTNPSSLDALVPEYLRKLPKDPFATASTVAEKPYMATSSRSMAGAISTSWIA